MVKKSFNRYGNVRIEVRQSGRLRRGFGEYTAVTHHGTMPKQEGSLNCGNEDVRRIWSRVSESSRGSRLRG